MKREREYSVENLKKMSTDDLNALLNRELGEPTPDGSLMSNVVRVLESRESNNVEMPEGAKVACEVAWNQYQENCEKIDRARLERNTRKSFGWLSRVAVIAVVLSIVIFAVPSVAGTENIFALVGRWTQSVFEFFDPENDDPIQTAYVFRTDNPDLQSIYDAVYDIGVTQPVVPMWVPEGYELEELKVTENPGAQKVCAVLKKVEKSIVLSLIRYHSVVGNQYFKDEEGIQCVDLYGVDHYLMSNDGTLTAIWTTGTVECCLTVEDDEDVFLKMLRSIYEMEG